MRAMKDSGIEWIGEIPQTWETKKLKFLVGLRTEKTANKSVSSPYVGLEHVESSAGSLIEDYEAVLDFAGDTLDFKTGDVLFGKLRPYLAKAIQAETDGRCSSEFWVMKPHSVNGRFLLYAVLSHGFISCIDQSTFGVKMPRAEWEYAGNQELALPDGDTQRKIADYLDTKCAEIDALITAKEKTNSLLKERRQSIIYEAVTKGLNPDAPMKDSGVEWIGEIPQEWYVDRLKYCANLDSEKLSEKTDPEYAFNYIDISSVTEYGGIGGTQEMTFEKSPSRARMVVHDGDTIISTVRTYLKAIAYIDGLEDHICSTGFCVVTPNEKLHPKFGYYLMQSDYFVQKIVSESVGVSYPAISSTEIGNMSIAIPVPEEQARIAYYLDTKCAEIDALISANEATIKKLKEYRQSIIYEAVTGKIEI